MSTQQSAGKYLQIAFKSKSGHHPKAKLNDKNTKTAVNDSFDIKPSKKTGNRIQIGTINPHHKAILSAKAHCSWTLKASSQHIVVQRHKAHNHTKENIPNKTHFHTV